MIDGHGLIQALGKPHGCQTFGDYADVFLNNVTSHFRCHTTRVDVVFYRYIGQQSIKAVTRSKRVGKRPIRKVIIGRNVPLPQVWSNFIASDENKADLARFLTEIIVTKGTDLPQQCELVTGGRFSCATHARSTSRSEVKLQGNHEEADTRLVLHSCEAVNQGYKRVLVICSDTDAMLLLVHFIPAQTAEVWMISGTAKKRKCYPIHALSERLAKPLRDNLLSFHAFTGCDTSAFSAHGKRSCWKTSQNHPHLVQGIGRETPWNFTPHALSSKDLAAGRPGAYRHPFSHRHLCMDDRVRLLESCMDKTASYSRCVSRAGHLWMQG